jgi:hypothetical protein
MAVACFIHNVWAICFSSLFPLPLTEELDNMLKSLLRWLERLPLSFCFCHLPVLVYDNGIHSFPVKKASIHATDTESEK